MNKKEYKQKDISEAIDKDKSVVSRELKRNCDLRNNAYRSSLEIDTIIGKNHAKGILLQRSP